MLGFGKRLFFATSEAGVRALASQVGAFVLAVTATAASAGQAPSTAAAGATTGPEEVRTGGCELHGTARSVYQWYPDPSTPSVPEAVSAVINDATRVEFYIGIGSGAVADRVAQSRHMHAASDSILVGGEHGLVAVRVSSGLAAGDAQRFKEVLGKGASYRPIDIYGGARQVMYGLRFVAEEGAVEVLLTEGCTSASLRDAAGRAVGGGDIEPRFALELNALVGRAVGQ